MSILSNMIRSARGREATIEDIVQACAIRGGFDDYLPFAKSNLRTVVRGRRGHPDVEILNDMGRGSLGVEVKISSQVNWGYYGGGFAKSQLDEMANHVDRLVIITSESRAARETWPDEAIILTLDDLASIAVDVGLTADDVVTIGLGHAA